MAALRVSALLSLESFLATAGKSSSSFSRALRRSMLQWIWRRASANCEGDASSEPTREDRSRVSSAVGMGGNLLRGTLKGKKLIQDGPQEGQDRGPASKVIQRPGCKDGPKSEAQDLGSLW